MIKQLLKDYKISAYPKVADKKEMNAVTITQGLNEGYFVIVVYDCKEYTFRTHSYDEAMKIVGVMLTVIDPKW